MEETNTGRDPGPQVPRSQCPGLTHTRTHAHTNAHTRYYRMSRKQSMVEGSTSGCNPLLSLSKFFLKSDLNYPISSNPSLWEPTAVSQ